MVLVALTPADRGSAPAEAAFRAVFDAEFAYVWTSLRRLGVPQRDLEDVTHEVFIEILRHFGTYDRTRPIRPWLFGFAWRVASEYRRRAGNRREVMGAPMETFVGDEAADTSLEAREARELVARALEAVDLQRRGVFILYELDERPMAEIAEVLGIPLHTAYSRLRVAREEFTARLRRLQRGGP